MRLSNIVSSVGFKSAIYSLLIFILVLTFIIGPSIFYLVKSAMFEELKSQVLEEVVLFKVIHNTGGRAALLDSMARLEYQQERVSHTSRAGLFSKDGAKLGGDWELAPDFVGWRKRIFIGDSSNPKDNYLAYTSTVGETNLVVGRNVESINTILTKLIWVLVFAGIVVSVLSLLLGYFANRSVSLKLNRISQTLDKFADGDTKARLSIGRSNDQISRISVQVNAYLDRLSILINSIRNTATAIAHDLRTPLNRAFLKLQEAKSFDGDAKNHLQLIEHAELELLNVGDVFDTMLRISTIEATHDRSKFEEIYCDQLLSEIAETYIPVAEESLQRLIYSPCESKALMLYADERMLRQMLSNLIENAIVHCPRDTEITLSCKLISDSSVCIQISDNGPGIAKENHDQALSPFGRLDPSRNIPGTGLGLALVKAIVTRHNANLTLLDNRPGLRVSIVFPVVATH